MKKLFIFIAITFFALASISCKKQGSNNGLFGSWQSGNIVMTFTKDSLYIDEINNEGDEFTYIVEGNIIKYKADYLSPYPSGYNMSYEIKQDTLFITIDNNEKIAFKHLKEIYTI